MVGLPDGEKVWKYVYSSDRIHERDRHPDRQTGRQTDGRMDTAWWQ